jgi:hypothetical protein
MAYASTFMGLAVWDLDSDPYDHNDLVANWEAVDQHDHTPGKGAPLPIEAIPLIPHTHAPDILGDCSVDTNQICDDAVTAPKIAQNAVGSSELATNAVGNAHMQDNAIDTAELVSQSVTEPKLGNSSVTAIKIKDANVTAAKIGDRQVVNRHIGDKAVNNAKLGDNSVTSRVLDNNSVYEANIAANAVGNSELQDDSVGPNELQPIASCMLALSSDKIITENALTSVSWQYIRHESGADMANMGASTQRIYARATGIYLISANIMWHDQNQGTWKNFDNGRYMSRIRANGSNIGGIGPMKGYQEGSGGGAPHTVRQSCSAVLAVGVGTWFDVAVKHVGSAHNQYLKSDNLGCNFSVTYLGAMK